MQNTVLRVFFRKPEVVELSGYFIAQDIEDMLILNIILNEDFFVEKDNVDSNVKRRNIVHRKIIGVHEFIHAISNISARKDSRLKITDIENQVHNDIDLRELQDCLNLPDELYEDKKACNC